MRRTDADRVLYPDASDKRLVSPAMVRQYSEQIDLIARLVAQLPSHPASRIQAQRLRIISIELARRAGELA